MACADQLKQNFAQILIFPLHLSSLPEATCSVSVTTLCGQCGHTDPVVVLQEAFPSSWCVPFAVWESGPTLITQA